MGVIKKEYTYNGEVIDDSGKTLIDHRVFVKSNDFGDELTLYLVDSNSNVKGEIYVSAVYEQQASLS